MQSHVQEWLNLLLRWFHLIAGIGWIGSSFYFMWLDSALTPPSPEREGVQGELWMVHSGGFYRVEKRGIGPGTMPAVLHWFKWEAALTWLSGVCLLVVVYYLGGGAYLVDASISSISVGAAAALGLGSMVGAWAIYDTLWRSSLAKTPAAAVVSLLGLGAAAYGLSRVLSGRGAFIHVGAIMGTIMVANVWMRILPAQHAMIAATKEGRAPDLALGAGAKQRSGHNNYMTLPVVFIMLSNHFPSTYGHRAAWAVLFGLGLAGAGVRHFMNTGSRVGMATLAAGVAGVVALFFVTTPTGTFGGGDHAGATAVETGVAGSGAPAVALKPIDPATVGSVRGTVALAGVAPALKELVLPTNCASRHPGPAFQDDVLVKDGKLANAFVWLSAGAEGFEVGPPPATEVEVDQDGCVFRPRVVGVRAGEPVAFVNSDPLLHNVNVIGTGKTFNLSLPAPGVRIARKLDKPEIMVRLKCDVHPWMTAFVGVVAHPWFAVSDASGAFSIAGVPPGAYTIEAWHEVYGRLSAAVTVAPSGGAETVFTFTAK